MKKLTLLTLPFLLASLFHPVAYAQEKEKPIEEVVAEEAQDAIEKIKDAVASKVAELNLVEKRGIFGEVVETATTEITIEDEAGNQRIIEIDELTRFEGERQSDDFGISDIEAGNSISAVGLYNKDTEKLLARFITQKINIPEHLSGAISEVDEDEFTITIVTKGGNEYLIDIERSTDTFVYEEEELLDSGFSRLVIGEKVIVVALPNQNEENRYSAERVLHFAELPPSDDVKKYLENSESSTEATPTP